MLKTKPTVLTRQLFGKRIAAHVQVNIGKSLREDITIVRKALSSQASSELFLLVAKGICTPSELVGLSGKSKFAVSLQLSELRHAGLLKYRSVITSDLRQKEYEVVWERISQVFQQDHALELEIYLSHLLGELIGEIHGTVMKTELAISGNGKLGLVKEINTTSPSIHLKMEQIEGRQKDLLWEFIGLFRGYLLERRFATIREYFAALYEEMAEHYARFPQRSELRQFLRFMERCFTKASPIDEVWKKYVPEHMKEQPHLPNRRIMSTIKLFSEAGSTDPAGRYVLNPDVEPLIKPGTHLTVYPSFTYL
jgi:DNA-binding transcriptional ArsR family regulator